MTATVVRREHPGDHAAVRMITAAAFAKVGTATPVEVVLLDRLRASTEWLPALSLVAERDGDVVGHVVCSRAFVGECPVLALGPVSVLPSQQRTGIGSALMHAVVGAADALDEPVVVLLGHTDYYPRFGFLPACELGIEPPEAGWGAHFQARALSASRADVRGAFRFAPAFDGL